MTPRTAARRGGEDGSSEIAAFRRQGNQAHDDKCKKMARLQQIAVMNTQQGQATSHVEDFQKRRGEAAKKVDVNRQMMEELQANLYALPICREVIFS